MCKLCGGPHAANMQHDKPLSTALGVLRETKKEEKRNLQLKLPHGGQKKTKTTITTKIGAQI